ncbi:hypothetical protein CC2G_007140 [Coprinopsis cinerea AmutBmut pab1-1]|nr:hypothetical protein CC2G_007140 [Coprinopsis cinerea AmutBmut pab1-1]
MILGRCAHKGLRRIRIEPRNRHPSGGGLLAGDPCPCGVLPLSSRPPPSESSKIILPRYFRPSSQLTH